MLGLPTGLPALARSRLLSWPGKARAALEPLLPRTDGDDDLGLTVRRRFGAEVYDRLVGPAGRVDQRRRPRPHQPGRHRAAGGRGRRPPPQPAARPAPGNRPTGAAAAPGLPHPSRAASATSCTAWPSTLRDDGVRPAGRARRPASIEPSTASATGVGGVAADAVVLAVPADAAAAALADVGAGRRRRPAGDRATPRWRW